MRDSLPLPGVTPAEVVSQLAHRVFGPLQPTRTRIVLDYLGLLANSAETLIAIAARHHVTSRTVTNNAAAVRAHGTRQPLAPLLVMEAERSSTPEDDHLGRVRIATTLGLTRPEPCPVDPPPNDNRSLPAARLAVARTGVRLLTALGPTSTLPMIADPVPVSQVPGPEPFDGRRFGLRATRGRLHRRRPGPVAPPVRCGAIGPGPSDRHPSRGQGPDPRGDDPTS